MSGLLTTAILARIRAAATAALADECEVQRKTMTSDGAGGWKETWATVVTVACNVAPTGNQPTERAIADRLGSQVAYTVAMPAETAVTAADQIIIDGRTFRIAGVIARTGELTRRCVCVEAS